ncbi:MAG TPA: tetratricopeptide repeat protein, partial [Isosphaeraceae bacterium]|nr:tetratricopeptide repeat protein [Isosphaeraceae bacterium]
ADFYPGGRWLIGCAGMPNLAAAIRTLDSDLGVTFTDAEKLDDTRAAKRILQNLQERAERGAAARAGEPNPPQPRALLILDNIDDARLLQPPHTDLLSGRAWLHVLATTRLGPKELSPDDVRHRLQPVVELPADDAFRLIESYQPHGRFAGEDEWAAAREIVTLLQGFTLAVEVVAVHLAERGGPLKCAALRDRLKAEGLTGLENIAGLTTRGIPHVERLLTVTLAPTLATLSAPESYTLSLAALLPPDHVPLPWLRAVAAQTFPDLGQDAQPGYDDPWLTIVNHLISLRLLQVIELAADGRTPRLCRVQPLVQYDPDHPDVARDLNNLAELLRATNRLAEAEPLLRRAVEILLKFTHATGHEHPHFEGATNNYTGLLAAMGLSNAQIDARLYEFGRSFGMSLGGGATPGNETRPG